MRSTTKGLWSLKTATKAWQRALSFEGGRDLWTIICLGTQMPALNLTFSSPRASHRTQSTVYSVRPYMHQQLPIRAEISIKYNRNNHISSFCIHNGQKNSLICPFSGTRIGPVWSKIDGTLWRYVPYRDDAKPYQVPISCTISDCLDLIIILPLSRGMLRGRSYELLWMKQDELGCKVKERKGGSS